MQIKTKIVSSHTTDSEPVKQEVNGTVILPPLVFPGDSLPLSLALSDPLHRSEREREIKRGRGREREREGEREGGRDR